jgi:hypothetical protein
MNSIPQITLDTNCVINLLDFSAKTPTSIDVLSEIIQYGLSSRANIAITTRVEADLLNDKDDNRKSEMLRKIQMLPIVGTIGRWGTSKWDSGDVYTDEKYVKIWLELQMLIFPGLNEKDAHFINKRNDIDHLIGHLINKRDIFVTDDKGILKKNSELKISSGIIVMLPSECAKYLEEINEQKIKQILCKDDINTKYLSPSLTGRVVFDYSNNNGSFNIGNGFFFFETKWSKASDITIHVYKDGRSIDSIALAKGVSEIIEIKDASIFDYSSRCRSPNEGQVVIFKNTNGIYSAVKIIDIKDDSRHDDKDEITFEYIIQPDGSSNFSNK